MNRYVSILILVAVHLWSAAAWAGDAESVESAMQAGDYPGALDAADRWFDADGGPDAVKAKARVLAAMGRKDAALTLLDAHRDIFEAADFEATRQEVTTRDNPPAYVPSPTTRQTAQTIDNDGPSQVLGWALFAGGAFALAGGAVAFVVSNVEANKIACSPVSSAPKSGCTDGEGYGNLTLDEFKTKSDGVGTIRLVSAVMGGIGGILIGWGAYNLLGSSEDTSVSIFPTRGGAAFEFNTHF